MTRIDVAELRARLQDGGELALLDGREQGVYHRGHLFHAANVPLSSLELLLGRLVPRCDAPIVWCDGGGADDVAERARAKAAELGWTAQAVLDGGVPAWAAAGGEVYAGINTPSKAFGELVEQRLRTPHITADELHRSMGAIDATVDDGAGGTRRSGGAPVVVLDARPRDEFRRMSIPGAIDCPGAELVHRIRDLAPDPDTLVVVNCAGRTRSIIGAQSLLEAGVPNRVVALENGTMGWALAGLTLDRGREEHAPEPSTAGRTWAVSAAAEVGNRLGVRSIDAARLATWSADQGRTTYVFDVRTPEEFEAGHLPGSRSAPGGQLVQATDDYVAVRNARVVLVDDDGARATMTAGWLRRAGWAEAVVLDGGVHGTAGDAPAVLEKGKEARVPVGSVPTIRVAELAERLGEDGLVVLDIGTSVKYRRGHVPGAWWGVRSRLAAARSAIGPVATLVLVSTDGQLARLAVPEARERWPGTDVRALAGGNKGWRHTGHAMEPGFDRATTTADDVWYKPTDQDDDRAQQHMRDYLTWEIGLADQVARDPLVSFPDLRPLSRPELI